MMESNSDIVEEEIIVNPAVFVFFFFASTIIVGPILGIFAYYIITDVLHERLDFETPDVNLHFFVISLGVIMTAFGLLVFRIGDACCEGYIFGLHAYVHLLASLLILWGTIIAKDMNDHHEIIGVTDPKPEEEEPATTPENFFAFYTTPRTTPRTILRTTHRTTHRPTHRPTLRTTTHRPQTSTHHVAGGFTRVKPPGFIRFQQVTTAMTTAMSTTFEPTTSTFKPTTFEATTSTFKPSTPNTFVVTTAIPVEEPEGEPAVIYHDAAFESSFHGQLGFVTTFFIFFVMGLAMMSYISKCCSTGGKFLLGLHIVLAHIVFLFLIINSILGLQDIVFAQFLNNTEGENKKYSWKNESKTEVGLLHRGQLLFLCLGIFVFSLISSSFQVRRADDEQQSGTSGDSGDSGESE